MGTCFCRRVLLSSFFFSHPESCLTIEIFVGKSDVLGEGLGGGEEEMQKKERKTRKNIFKKESEKMKNEKNEKNLKNKRREFLKIIMFLKN